MGRIIIKTSKTTSTYRVGLYKVYNIFGYDFKLPIEMYRIKKNNSCSFVLEDKVKSWIEINNISEDDIYIYDWYRKEINL